MANQGVPQSAHTPAAVPLAALPLDYPLPGQSHAALHRVPGMVVTIGIISIVVGTIGLGGGGLSSLYSGVIYLISQQSQHRQAMTQNLAQQRMAAMQQQQLQASSGQASPMVDPRGFPSETRHMITNVLAARQWMDPARRHQLDLLLAKAGQDIFPVQPLTPASIAQAISDSGTLPNPDVNSPAPGPTFFVISAGRIEVAKERAVFRPSDSTQETIRVVDAPAPLQTATPLAPFATPLIPPNPTEVAAAMQSVERQVGTSLTAPQRATIKAELSAPGGILAAAKASNMPGWTNMVCHPYASGDVLIVTAFGSSSINVQPSGVVRYRRIHGLNQGPNLQFRVSIPACGIVFCEGIFSIFLSIYLLIIGILTLRQSPRGAMLHLIYALLKIPAALLCAAGWYWIAQSIFQNGSNNAAASVMAVSTTVIVVLTGVSLLYPIALLIVLNTLTLRAYYSPPSAA
jgi:type II secretory pathway pseudopilin PulG